MIQLKYIFRYHVSEVVYWFPNLCSLCYFIYLSKYIYIYIYYFYLYLYVLYPYIVWKDLLHYYLWLRVLDLFFAHSEATLEFRSIPYLKKKTLVSAVIWSDNSCTINSGANLAGYQFDEHDRDSGNIRLQFARYPGARSGGGRRGKRWNDLKVKNATCLTFYC